MTASVMGSEQTLGSQIDDQLIEFYASRAVKTVDHHPDDNNIEITTYEQNLILTGQVTSSSLRDQLAKAVAKVKGVKAVYNYLTVGPVRTHEQWLEDIYLTGKVKADIITSDASHFRFNILTEKGTVYLMGHTSKAELSYVLSRVRQVPGVKKVVAIFPAVDYHNVYTQ